MSKARNINNTKKWTKLRLVNLILNSYYDLFSDPLNKPTPNQVRLWLDKYIHRETFKNKLKK